MDIRTIYDKYRDGDHITNEELSFGIREYQRLANSLQQLGKEFYLSWKEIYKTLSGLIEYQNARKQK